MNSTRLRVAIDGPASCGKGTVASLLAERLGYIFLDTGAMYRAIAFLALQKGLNLDNDTSIGELAEKVEIMFRRNEGSESPRYVTFANGVDVSEAIRSPEVDIASSHVAVLPRVRNALVNKQKEIAKMGGIVMEGRDITTVVMPDAHVKIFLTASVEERARRRYMQRVARGIPADMNELISELAERDRRDSERDIGALKIAPDAIIVDSTHLNADETVMQVESEIRHRFPNSRE